MAVVSCTFCGQSFSADQSGDYLCPHCSQKQYVRLESIAAESHQLSEPKPVGVDATAWEDRRPGELLEAIRRTWSACCLHPEAFFRNLRPKGFLKDALVWGVVFGSLRFVLGYAGTRGLGMIFQRSFGGFLGEAWPASQGGSAFWILLGILSPVLVLIGLLVQTAILQTSLTVIGVRKAGFETTLKAVSYAQSPGPLALVPLFGGFVATIWTLGLVAIGIKELHRATLGQAALAILLPVILCCCLGGGLIGLMSAALFKQLLPWFQT